MNLQGDLKFDLKSNFNTDGRTDGLTKKVAQLDSHLTAVDAHAHTTNRGSLGVGER